MLSFANIKELGDATWPPPVLGDIAAAIRKLRDSVRHHKTGITILVAFPGEVF